MLSDPIEFYELLDTLETSEQNLFVDHTEQILNATKTYQPEYDLSDEGFIEILNNVIKNICGSDKDVK